MAHKIFINCELNFKLSVQFFLILGDKKLNKEGIIRVNLIQNIYEQSRSSQGNDNGQ
jgi:hypothetical protein